METPEKAIGMRRRLAALGWRGVVLQGLLWAVTIETITAVLRLGADLSAQHDTAWLAPLTFGIRIHHGYIGILCLIAAGVRRWSPEWRNGLCIIGIGLFVSDALHHFVVLWIVTGAPEFNFVYH